MDSGPKATGASQGEMLGGTGGGPRVPGSLSGAGAWEVWWAPLRTHARWTPLASVGGVDSTLSWFWTRQEWGSGQGPFPAWAGLREMQGVRVRVRPGGAAV